MDGRLTLPSELAEPRASNIFISYRREDAPAHATLLKNALAGRFGEGSVFIDVASLRPGDNFVRDIEHYVSLSDVLIAVIGPRWLSLLEERRRVLDNATDYVRVEIEAALARQARAWVLPVLVDGAVMPAGNALPRSMRRLCEINAAELRHKSWDDDVDGLLTRVEEICASRPPEGQASVNESHERPGIIVQGEPVGGVRTTTGAPAPESDHYAEVVRHITRDNAVITFLGPGANYEQAALATPGAVGGMSNDDLAARLAKEFDYPAGPSDLAEISQFVLLTMGKVDLYKALRRILKASVIPGPVHRFLASLPAILQAQNREQCYQVIATTNYDKALERAFDEAQEPYDLAVYIAQGEFKGRFLHVPWDGEERVVSVPNTYLDFPIDEDGIVERTIILKVHGAVEETHGRHPLLDNSYVITEDDYINYLSRSPVESLVPFQLLNKMRESHFLFLGYPVRDWNLRVFLQRIWAGERLGAQSWSIADRAEAIERRLWNEIGVDLFSIPVFAYCDELRNGILQLDKAET